MNSVVERIEKLRALMAEKGVDAYIVPTADFHQSEYVGEYFKARRFISGFTGSAGTAVITKDNAGLWTDGRYFIQAEKELSGSGITLQKMLEPGVPTITEFLADYLPENGTLAFDGRVVSMGDGVGYEEALSYKNITFKYSEDLVDLVWTDRPALAANMAFFLEEKYSGESTTAKLARVRSIMEENKATVHVISALDDICWLLNIRGADIDFCPFVLSYAIVSLDGVSLYVDSSKVTAEMQADFDKNHVTVHPYNDVYEDVKKIAASETVMIDPFKMNYAIYKNIPGNVRIVKRENPTVLFKAMKNPVEIENIHKSHLKDGIAVTKFMYWVKSRYEKEVITELSAAEKLRQFRAEQEGFIDQSFSPISAYKEHASMMHYSATEESDVRLEAGGFFLNDTGGSYYEGSTDITRTFVLGTVDKEMKFYFTTILRAVINLSWTKFLKGCCGYNLDVLARQPVWDIELDYKCSTGHGVGYLSNIHEAPTAIRWYNMPGKNERHPLEDGMVLTNEPGIYEEGWFGIRTENELLVRTGNQNKYGQYMHFETLTLAPIDLDGIDPEVMSPAEKKWLNDYHAEVFEKIAPHLTEEERTWLKEYTKAI